MNRQIRLYAQGKLWFMQALIFIILMRRRRRRRQAKIKRKKRICWVRPWLQRRQQLGAYDNLMIELANEDIPGYIAFQRLAPDLFTELLEKVRPHIEKKTTNMRMPISAGARLAITLRFLATGNTYMSQQFEFRVANNTISKLVPETCKAIFRVLAEDYFKCPSTQEEWLHVADEFMKKWQFPNCLGALDGKHVRIKPPAHSGSVFFNYKHTFSIVLMALVDSSYRFLYCDVGANGRVADGGVWANTDLAQDLERGLLDIPPPQPLPNDDEDMPFTILADDAFPLRSFIMKPFPHRNLSQEKRLFNYRLSRARRVVENAFGILANRWRVLLSHMLITPERAELIVLACCALHNFLRTRLPTFTNHLLDREDEESHEVIPGAWRLDENLMNLAVLRGRNASKAAKAQREYLCAWVNGPGAVAWQDRMV